MHDKRLPDRPGHSHILSGLGASRRKSIAVVKPFCVPGAEPDPWWYKATSAQDSLRRYRCLEPQAGSTAEVERGTHLIQGPGEEGKTPAPTARRITMAAGPHVSPGAPPGAPTGAGSLPLGNQRPVLPLQGEVKASISLFMSYVHTTVNEMSRLYLATERRYNYTTPKTFLEQIKLYQNLLARKRTELVAKIERLENGLLKLQSTASQVGKSPRPK